MDEQCSLFSYGNGNYIVFRVHEDGVILSPLLIKNYHPGSIVLKQDASSDEPIHVDYIERHEPVFLGPTWWDRIEIHIHSPAEMDGGSWRHQVGGKSKRTIEEKWEVIE